MRQLPTHAILYEPENKDNIKGAVQIIHGMCEHQLRYKPLAEYLNKNGYAVVTCDLRGHGDNVAVENELGYFGENAVPVLLGDIHEITMAVKDRYPDIPYFILAHSMGTLIAANYFRKYDSFLDGLILSGMPGNNSASGIAKKLIKIIESSKGAYYRSPFINRLVNGPFSKPFRSEGSEFAWLSKDKENVKRYESDPKCGFVFTLNGFYTLMELLEGTYKGKTWIKKNPDIPIRLMSGANDPCMGNRKNFMKSVKLFKDAGYSNVDYVLFDGQRHEIFNDTAKNKALEYMLDVLNKVADKDFL